MRCGRFGANVSVAEGSVAEWSVAVMRFALPTSSDMMKRMWTRVEEVRTVALPKVPPGARWTTTRRGAGNF